MGRDVKVNSVRPGHLATQGYSTGSQLFSNFRFRVFINVSVGLLFLYVGAYHRHRAVIAVNRASLSLLFFPSSNLLCALVVLALAIFPHGYQVPLQKDVKVNWVRPGQVVHESQQVDYVLAFENCGAAPGHSMEKEGGLCMILSMSYLIMFAVQSRHRRTYVESENCDLCRSSSMSAPASSLVASAA